MKSFDREGPMVDGIENGPGFVGGHVALGLLG
jgi:hypothetical protein